MTRKALSLTTLTIAVSLTGAAGTAAAQSAGAAAGPAQPPNIAAVVNGLTGGQKLAAGVSITRSGTSLTSGPSAIALGWNFGHASNCGWATDSAGNQYYLVFTIEGGFILEANNNTIALGLLTPCVNGHLFAWHVTSTSTGAYDQTYSYPYSGPGYGG